MSNFVASRLALVLLVVATVAMTAADEFLETRELQQDIVPESECQVYRDEINDCVSNCSNTNCGPFVCKYKYASVWMADDCRL